MVAFAAVRTAEVPGPLVFLLLAVGRFTGMRPMSKDRRQKRDLHALNEDGMVLCNPRDKEAAHRADMEGIATDDRSAVTCRKCLSLLYQRDKARNENTDLP
jgi:hypothetical protein